MVDTSSLACGRIPSDGDVGEGGVALVEDAGSQPAPVAANCGVNPYQCCGAIVKDAATLTRQCAVPADGAIDNREQSPVIDGASDAETYEIVPSS